MDELLRDRPDLRGQVVLLALAYASRQDLPEYLAYGTEVELAARRVNETWADRRLEPCVLEVADDPDRSLGGPYDLRRPLINPLRDGLNLVAKEGPIVNTKDGVLAPLDRGRCFRRARRPRDRLEPLRRLETASALARSLEMPAEERADRAVELRGSCHEASAR